MNLSTNLVRREQELDAIIKSADSETLRIEVRSKKQEVVISKKNVDDLTRQLKGMLYICLPSPDCCQIVLASERSEPVTIASLRLWVTNWLKLIRLKLYTRILDLIEVKLTYYIEIIVNGWLMCLSVVSLWDITAPPSIIPQVTACFEAMLDNLCITCLIFVC